MYRRIKRCDLNNQNTFKNQSYRAIKYVLTNILNNTKYSFTTQKVFLFIFAVKKFINPAIYLFLITHALRWYFPSLLSRPKPTNYPLPIRMSTNTCYSSNHEQKTRRDSYEPLGHHRTKRLHRIWHL